MAVGFCFLCFVFISVRLFDCSIPHCGYSVANAHQFHIEFSPSPLIHIHFSKLSRSRVCRQPIGCCQRAVLIIIIFLLLIHRRRGIVCGVCVCECARVPHKSDNCDSSQEFFFFDSRLVSHCFCGMAIECESTRASSAESMHLN